ncbi:TPA: hypothetical protein ACH3X2_007729 [Trebouxia sp. C0005]
MKIHHINRDTQWLWQTTRRRILHLWRQKHGRLILLAPVLGFLFTVVWSASSGDVGVKSVSTGSPLSSASSDSATQAHTSTFNLTTNTTSKLSSFVSPSSTTSQTDAQTDEEEEEAKAPDLTKAMLDILDFPEDLDGPNDPALLATIELASFDSNQQLQGMIAASSRLFRPDGKFKQNATKDHMVAAMPSDRSHLPLVEGTRSWRKDIKSFVALSESALAATHPNLTGSNEIWGYYPDDWPLKGLHAGDTRAALTPFLAHEAYEGQYSWLLYGDDDTLFFVDSVSELLQDFDPSLPYVITDHYWWADEPDSDNHFHPHERAPRCLPCHWSQEGEDRSLRADGYQPFVGLPACPCTAEHICRHDGRGFFDESCNMPVHPHRAYSIHGGAGAIFSIGLMQKLPLKFMEDCMATMTGTGGDALLSRCIWKAGYAFTDPGYSFYHWEAKSFDPGPESSRQLVQDLRTALLGACPPESLEVLSHIATTHIRAIAQGQEESIQVMHTLTDLYDRWRARLHSIMSESKPKSAAASKHPFPSSSFRSQQITQKMAPQDEALSHADLGVPIPNAIPKGIPKGVPKKAPHHSVVEASSSMLTDMNDRSADENIEDVAAEQQALGFNAFQDPSSDDYMDLESAQGFVGGNLAQQEAAPQGFLKVIDEDDDNLAMLREIKAKEEEAADEDTRGTDQASTTPDQSEIQTLSASSDEVEGNAAKSSAAFDSPDFDRLLEAASSGGMSDNLDSDSGGVLQGVDLQGPTRRLNSTLSSNLTMPTGPVVRHPAQNLTQAMQQLNLKTSSGRAEALRQQRLAAQLTKTPVGQ